MADTDIDFDLLVKAGGPVRHFKAGDIIFREGGPAAELFVVKSPDRLLGAVRYALARLSHRCSSSGLR